MTRLVSSWLEERRFDRDHRPHLYTGYLPPVEMPDGSTYQPEIVGIFCRKHGGSFSDCPKSGKDQTENGRPIPTRPNPVWPSVGLPMWGLYLQLAGVVVAFVWFLLEAAR